MGRRPEKIDLSEPLTMLTGKRVLVTGAAGAIGQPLVELLRKHSTAILPTDVETHRGPWGVQRLDITSFDEVMHAVAFHEPDLIVNLAAAKLAPMGEVSPWTTLDASVNGAHNLVSMGRRVVQVSTCKAADPEIAYGAGKLAAEKIVMGHGGTVVRLYNVPEAGPSMLTIWADTPEDQRLQVVGDCDRHYLFLTEAIASIVWAMVLPPARYAAEPGPSINTATFAVRAFEGRQIDIIPPRRGDRISEPHHARCERVVKTRVVGLNRIISQHDEDQGDD